MQLNSDKPAIGPFSLTQAENILSSPRCPYCNHELGKKDQSLNKLMCNHQYLASEVVRAHRKLAEANVEFRTAADMMGASA